MGASASPRPSRHLGQRSNGTVATSNEPHTVHLSSLESLTGFVHGSQWPYCFANYCGGFCHALDGTVGMDRRVDLAIPRGMSPLAHAGSWAWLEMAPFCALLLLEEPTDSLSPPFAFNYHLILPIPSHRPLGCPASLFPSARGALLRLSLGSGTPPLATGTDAHWISGPPARGRMDVARVGSWKHCTGTVMDCPAKRPVLAFHTF